MEPRRRFFPAKRAQQVPGQRVAVEVQLRAEPPPCSCECDVMGLGWLIDTGPVGSLASFSQESDGRWRLRGFGVEAIWVGTPAQLDASGVPYATTSGSWQCHYYKTTPASVMAAIQGASLADAKWTWQWDGKDVGDPMSSDVPSDGVFRVSAWGNMLLVELLEFEWVGSGRDLQKLTAWAHCGGERVGEIVLEFVQFQH